MLPSIHSHSGFEKSPCCSKAMRRVMKAKQSVACSPFRNSPRSKHILDENNLGCNPTMCRSRAMRGVNCILLTEVLFRACIILYISFAGARRCAPRPPRPPSPADGCTELWAGPGNPDFAEEKSKLRDNSQGIHTGRSNVTCKACIAFEFRSVDQIVVFQCILLEALLCSYRLRHCVKIGAQLARCSLPLGLSGSTSQPQSARGRSPTVRASTGSPVTRPAEDNFNLA